MLCRMLVVFLTLVLYVRLGPLYDGMGPNVCWVKTNVRARFNDMFGMWYSGNSLSFVLTILWLWFQVLLV